MANASSSQLGIRLAQAAALCVAALALISVGAAFARYFWVADLLVHFRLQYAVTAAIAAIVLAWARRPIWFALALVTTIGNLAVIASSNIGLLADGPEGRVDGSVQPIRIASINVYFRNEHHDSLIKLLRETQPDAAVLVEVTQAWHESLQQLADEYPYRYYPNGSAIHKVMILSRWPLTDIEPIRLGLSPSPVVSATLHVRGQPLRLIAAHLSWPLGASFSHVRNEQIAAIARYARTVKEPLIVAGDFNITPFSPHYQAMLTLSGLTPAAKGFGWQPTWPSFMPLAGIQIDHVLVSRGIQVLKFWRGPDIHSDHLPVLVDLAPVSR